MKFMIVIGDKYWLEAQLSTNEQVIILFAQTIDLSEEYAKQLATHHNVLGFLSIETIFKHKPIGSYEFKIGEHNLYINKYYNRVSIAIIDFFNNEPRFFQFLRSENLWRLWSKTRWNIYVINNFLRISIPVVLTCGIISTSYMAYKYFYTGLDLAHKHQIISLINQG